MGTACPSTQQKKHEFRKTAARDVDSRELQDGAMKASPRTFNLLNQLVDGDQFIQTLSQRHAERQRSRHCVRLISIWCNKS